MSLRRDIQLSRAEHCRITLSFEMIGQWSNSQSIGSPLLIFIKVITARCVETKFIIWCKRKLFICHRWIRDRSIRTEKNHLWWIQFSKTKNHRSMIGCLFIINKIRKKTFIVQIYFNDKRSIILRNRYLTWWTKDCPAINLLNRAIQDGWAIKFINEQVW